MSSDWTLKIFVAAGRPNEIQNRYDASPQIQAAMDVAWDYLKVRSREQWSHPRNHSAKLSGRKKDFRDYYEIRLFAGKVQHRPIGYFGPNLRDFTILIWATEKGGKFTPASWRTTADSRRNQIQEGQAHVIDFDFSASQEASEPGVQEDVCADECGTQAGIPDPHVA